MCIFKYLYESFFFFFEKQQKVLQFWMINKFKQMIPLMVSDFVRQDCHIWEFSLQLQMVDTCVLSIFTYEDLKTLDKLLMYHNTEYTINMNKNIVSTCLFWININNFYSLLKSGLNIWELIRKCRMWNYRVISPNS